MFLLICMGLWLLQSMRAHQKLSTELISLSGQQRSLSQKILNLASEASVVLSERDRQEKIERFTEFLQEFEKTRDLLRFEKFEGRGLEGLPTLGSLNLIFVERSHDILVRLKNGEMIPPPEMDDLSRFVKGPLLEEMEKVSSELQRVHQSVDQRFFMIETLIFALLIVIFLLEIVLVFNPIIRSLYQALKTAEQNLHKLEKAEVELRESQMVFRGIYEGSPVGIITATPDNLIRQASPAFCRMLGYSEEELKTKSFAEISHPEDRFVGVEPSKKLLRGETDSVTFVKRYLSRKGETIWVTLNGFVLRNADGTPLYLMAVVEDVTEKKKSEDELKSAKEQALKAEEAAVRAARVKSEFLANMSHEIRTPLNGVLGMTDLLMKTPLSDIQKKYAQIISDSGNGLLHIINDILDFSKIEAGKMSLEILDFNLFQTVESQVALLATQARLKNLQIQTVFDPQMDPFIKGDPSRIGQVLLNLISNAIKFTIKGQIVIRVSLQRQQGREMVCFRVEDTGVGIGEDVKARLFQPFTQADGSTARKFGGTGLGLSISKQLIELMGGQIGVESELGEGSAFWFSIPYCPSVQTSHQIVSLPGKDVHFNGLRVLVAEDNVVNQLLMKSLLQSFGCSVQVVGNGQEALAAITQAHFDLVLMDCQMPEMDGYEATLAIRRREAGTGLRTPIVALTANALREDVQKCLSVGMDDFLSKPVRKDYLINVLEKFFEIKESLKVAL